MELIRIYDVARSDANPDYRGELDSCQAARREGIETLIGVVLADPQGWTEALGWAHEWGPTGLSFEGRCVRCGWDWDEECPVMSLCPGKPVPS